VVACSWLLRMVVVEQLLPVGALLVAAEAEAVEEVEQQQQQQLERERGQGHIYSHVQLLLPLWGSWPCGRRRIGRV